MDYSNEQDYGLVIMDLLAALKEKIVAIIVVTAVCGVIGLFFSAFLLPKRYEASVNMIVNAKSDMSSAVTSDDIYSSQNLVNTYAIIIKSNKVLNKVIEELALDMRYEDLYETVTVTPINNTQVMKIAVEHQDTLVARQIVESITRVAPAIVTDAVEAGSCKVISEVYVAEDPVFPNVPKFTLICALLGFVVYVGNFILKEIRNDYIVDDADVSRKLGIPVLGMIPDVEVK